jgi:hypothetical protein
MLMLRSILIRVLLHLDLRTLLVSAQRVCTVWRDSIVLNHELQKKLFLRSDSTAKPQFNPLLVEAFPFCFPHLMPTTSDYSLRVIARQDSFQALDAVPFPTLQNQGENRGLQSQESILEADASDAAASSRHRVRLDGRGPSGERTGTYFPRVHTPRQRRGSSVHSHHRHTLRPSRRVYQQLHRAL